MGTCEADHCEQNLAAAEEINSEHEYMLLDSNKFFVSYTQNYSRPYHMEVYVSFSTIISTNC
jgi:hypothetical protein